MSGASAGVSAIQKELRPLLSGCGFKQRGRRFRRTTADGLSQMIEFQVGRSDSPGPCAIPSYHLTAGSFTVGLGVYIPEVATRRGVEFESAIGASDPDLYERLGHLSSDVDDPWWPATPDAVVIADVRQRLESVGIPFLDRLSSREGILRAWDERRRMGAGTDVLVVLATILAGRGERDRARDLLRQHRSSTRSPSASATTGVIADRLGLGALDDEA